jgi:hypothetical protein
MQEMGHKETVLLLLVTEQVKIDKGFGQLQLVMLQGEHNKDNWLLRLVQVLEK